MDYSNEVKLDDVQTVDYNDDIHLSDTDKVDLNKTSTQKAAK